MPPAKKTPQNLVAATSFACIVDDVEYQIRKGQVVPADHAVVTGREELFAPADEVTLQAGVGET